MIFEVIWQSLPCSWININFDGASLNNLGLSACGGIFIYHNCCFLRAFSNLLGVFDYLIVELSDVISAIKFANDKGLLNIWLDFDSIVVVQAFKPLLKVLRQIHTR